MPVPAPEPTHRPVHDSGGTDADPVGRSDRDDRSDPDEVIAAEADRDDAAAERLRSLLQASGGWRDRMSGAAGLVPGGWRSPPTQLAAIVGAAAVLGVVAFVVLGSGRASSIDPVQVLPKVGSTAPSSTAPSGTPSAAPSDPLGASPGSAPVRIRVHAAGAVAAPGMRQLDPDARVGDLIAAAGGSTADADPDRINLAAPLHDGERVYVPRRGETDAPVVVAGGDPGSTGGGAASAPPAGGSAGPASSVPPARVDLNAADAAALDTLPGVGPATAAAIIRHRSENGPFRSVDDLQEVPGIGPAKLAALRDLVKVG